MELSPEMLLIIGLVASFLTQVLKWLGDKAGLKIPGPWQIVLLFVVAVGLAIGFYWSDLLADPISMIAGIMGVAVVIYKLLLEKVVFPAIRLG